MLTSFLRRTRNLAVNLLQQGLTPRRFAATTAAGITLGIHPIYGVTTAGCALLAQTFRLNHAWIQAMNYSMTLVKPLLIFPFLRFGERLFHAEPFPLSLTELSTQFSAAPLHTLQTFSWTFLHAFIGWLVWVPVVAGTVYGMTLWGLKGFGYQSTAGS